MKDLTIYLERAEELAQPLANMVHSLKERVSAGTLAELLSIQDAASAIYDKASRLEDMLADVVKEARQEVGTFRHNQRKSE